MKHVAEWLQATVQPADMRRSPKSIFPCGICNKKYSQPQGVIRHQREVHEGKRLCPNCDDFTWSRPYQLTKHFKEQHPHSNLDPILCDVTRRRREDSMNKKRLRQQQASPAIECDRRSHGKPYRNPYRVH
jgi:hypothetical protein